MKLRVNRALTDLISVWEKRRAVAYAIAMVWVLAIGWVAFLWNLGNVGLVDETEPLFAEAARQMTVTGNWITPYFNGAVRFDKPPLIYWLMAIGYKMIGVNEWAVRLPSAAGAIALCALGFWTLRHYGFPLEGTRRQPESAVKSSLPFWLCAFLGSALIALNPETIAWGRIGVSDMLLCACTSSALLCFFIGYASQEGRDNRQPKTDNGEQTLEKREARKFDGLLFTSPWYVAFYVLCALAVLTKGPVGIVLPGLIIGCFLLYIGKFREVVREMRVLRGSLLLLAIALPWFVLVTLANGQTYINTFFGYHNLERFTNVVNRHWAPWYFYFVVVAIGFAPWSIYLPLAIARLRFWERDRWKSLPRSQHLGLFALCWFSVIFCFFTIAVTKLPSYVLPLMPAAAILVALLFSWEVEKTTAIAAIAPAEIQETSPPRPSKMLALSGWVNVAAFVALSAGFFSSSRWLGRIKDPTMPNLSEVVQQSGLLIIGGAILAVMAVGCIWLLQRRQQSWLWGVNLVGLIAFLIFAVHPASFLMDGMRQMPLRQLAQTANDVKQPGEQLIMIGFEKPSLVFYTRKPVTYFRQSKEAIAHVKTIAESQPNPPSILILAYPSKFDAAGLQPNEYKVLNRIGAYQLVRVSKQVIARLDRPNPS